MNSVIACLVITLLPLSLLAQRRANANQSLSKLAVAAPESVGMDSKRLALIDEAVNDSIKRKETPGAVVLIGRQGKIVYRKAFGNRAVEPQTEAMTLDTIFDLASLTKVVATATAMMILVEQGKVRLGDPVWKYIPEFNKAGKANVTVEQLLTHRAGFVPDNSIHDYEHGAAEAMQRIYELKPDYEPGTKFIYSDVGYIVAAEIIRRVSGKTVGQFARENVFVPLGMLSTGFIHQKYGLDPYALHRSETTPIGKMTFLATYAPLAQFAPTEKRVGREGNERDFMRGEVHDPRSYLLGGVAGHAGLFSTADDLAVFCQMILNGGTYNGRRILSPYGVERMTQPRGTPLGEMRGLGWDAGTTFSSNRGDLFPLGTFGHTGFTGTSLWIDPTSQTFVVFLSNRVHPNGKGDVTRIRSFVASIVASSIIAPPFAPIFEHVAANDYYAEPRTQPARAPVIEQVHPVLTGIDVLVRDNFKQLEGRNLGLITNHTGKDRAGRATIDVFAAQKNLKLVALFSPEHGLRGLEDNFVGNTKDEKTGLPVYSLYDSKTKRPTDEMLAGIDTLVFDIQDIGCRFYTYITTCGYAMEEAARRNIKFVVLDRPNPINGNDVEGAVADEDLTKNSFIAYHPLPVRHGMTVGELMTMINAERKIGADLTVIKMAGWRRADFFDATTLTWINPSPNMRSLTEALLYPGIGLLETTNVSVGRGTDTPFEVVGAPYIDGQKLAEQLNQAGLAGARFVPVRFTPKASKFANEECGGINIIITDRATFRPVTTGIEIAYLLYRLYPTVWKVDDYLRLLVNRRTLAALKDGRLPHEIRGLWREGLSEFNSVRQKYLLY
ncbi:MAG: exo-beta-N-acetylmuramidase NamZ domain-containing protein [Acidobacteriota bacterium]